jgi:hypothetical protein
LVNFNSGDGDEHVGEFVRLKQISRFRFLFHFVFTRSTTHKASPHILLLLLLGFATDLKSHRTVWTQKEEIKRGTVASVVPECAHHTRAANIGRKNVQGNHIAG